MAEEQTVPTQQQGGDCEEAESIKPAMMVQLRAGFEQMGQSFDNRVVQLADRADDLAEQISSLRDQTSV